MCVSRPSARTRASASASVSFEPTSYQRPGTRQAYTGCPRVEPLHEPARLVGVVPLREVVADEPQRPSGVEVERDPGQRAASAAPASPRRTSPGRPRRARSRCTGGSPRDRRRRRRRAPARPSPAANSPNGARLSLKRLSPASTSRSSSIAALPDRQLEVADRAELRLLVARAVVDDPHGAGAVPARPLAKGAGELRVRDHVDPVQPLTPSSRSSRCSTIGFPATGNRALGRSSVSG